MYEKQLCNIQIKRLHGKKSNKKGDWLWRPSAYIVSSNIITASVPAMLNIVNQGSAASISRIARLDSNQPRKRETYRRKDDVFVYELQFLESEGLPVLQSTEKTV